MCSEFWKIKYTHQLKNYLIKDSFGNSSTESDLFYHIQRHSNNPAEICFVIPCKVQGRQLIKCPSLLESSPRLPDIILHQGQEVEEERVNPRCSSFWNSNLPIESLFFLPLGTMNLMDLKSISYKWHKKYIHFYGLMYPSVWILFTTSTLKENNRPTSASKRLLSHLGDMLQNPLSYSGVAGGQDWWLQIHTVETWNLVQCTHVRIHSYKEACMELPRAPPSSKVDLHVSVALTCFTTYMKFPGHQIITTLKKQPQLPLHSDFYNDWGDSIKKRNPKRPKWSLAYQRDTGQKNVAWEHTTLNHSFKRALGKRRAFYLSETTKKVTVTVCWFLHIQKTCWEFPEGSAVRTPCFHCGGPEFNPCWGN